MYSLADILVFCRREEISFPEGALRMDAEASGDSVESIRALMLDRLKDMELSIRTSEENSPKGKIVKDNASLLEAYRREGAPLSGPFVARAAQIAMSVATCNAAMGRIVAAPTAGSCGILPGLLFAYREQNDVSEDDMVLALLTAAAIGQVIARRATLSGAEGGCQAECGAAAAMGAAALAWLRGGSNEVIVNAVALALKSIMGLVCDPVAGLVEVPCVKRNGSLTAIGALAADMALAGVRSIIPPDEVIDAMGQVGRALPESLRETARGGLAVTPTGRRITEELQKLSRQG